MSRIYGQFEGLRNGNQIVNTTLAETGAVGFANYMRLVYGEQNWRRSRYMTVKLDGQTPEKLNPTGEKIKGTIQEQKKTGGYDAPWVPPSVSNTAMFEYAKTTENEDGSVTTIQGKSTVVATGNGRIKFEKQEAGD